MPIIVKRPKALGDLVQIWDYIADDSVERADAFITTIDAKFQTLSIRRVTPSAARFGQWTGPNPGGE